MQSLLNLKFKILLKSLGIMGFGYGHFRKSGMSAGNDKIKLTKRLMFQNQMSQLLLKKKLSKRLLRKHLKTTQRLI